MTAITASPAMAATGLPPKVLPWLPWAQQPRGRSGRNAGSDGKPVAQTLGDGHDVGRNALVHMDQPAAAAAHPRLDLVQPQQGTMLIAGVPGLREVTPGGTTTPFHPGLARAQRPLPCRRPRRPMLLRRRMDEDHLARQRLKGMRYFSL